jgi:hypothetical protein
LSKRGIPNALLPENFTDDDILVGDKTAVHVGFIQVKARHPDRSRSFIPKKTNESRASTKENQFCAFVWLGRVSNLEPPKHWLAMKRGVGEACLAHSAHGTSNWERRLYPHDLPPDWENRWSLFDRFLPSSER